MARVIWSTPQTVGAALDDTMRQERLVDLVLRVFDADEPGVLQAITFLREVSKNVMRLPADVILEVTRLYMLERLYERVCDADDAAEAAKRTPVVYFIAVDHRVKIGTTHDLKGRIASLHLPPDHKVLATFNGSYDVETKLHKKFAKHRLGRTEWFRLDEEILDFLAAARKRAGK